MRPADGGHLLADHRGMAHGTVPALDERARVDVARVVVPHGSGVTLEGKLADERYGRQRRGGREQLPSGEASFRHD